VTYAYDASGRRTSMTVAGESAVNYTWDNANRLTNITQGSSSVGLAYDNANRRTTLTLPNGVTVSYTYDLDSHVTGLTYAMGSTQLGNLTYVYDADGRVSTKGGSLAAVTLPAAVSGNTFNAANEMTAFNGTALSYDANGNLLSDGTNTYSWDARNHLTAIAGPVDASFVYDAFGRRAAKTLSGVSTEFLYDGLNSVQELNGSNPPSPTAELLTGLDIDEYFTRTDTSGTMDFLTDTLGSTIALTNSGGSINTSYTYGPFGNVTISGQSNANSYQFTARENDATGLYYYRARYYSPTFQRFIAQDPLDFESGDVNLYTYVANDPVSYIDPFGFKIVVQGSGGDYQTAVSYLNRDPGMVQIIQDLNASPTIFTVVPNSINNDSYNPTTHTINWDPHSALRCTSGGRQSPALGLGHEMAHGDAGWWDRLVGGMTVGAGNYDNWEEWRVIAGPETSAANTLGEDTRTDHRGTPYPVGGPTQR